MISINAFTNEKDLVPKVIEIDPKSSKINLVRPHNSISMR